jgi:hypothetical protein
MTVGGLAARWDAPYTKWIMLWRFALCSVGARPP